MNVSLTPELERMIHEKVKSGLYTSASEVIREALRLQTAYDDARRTQLERMNAMIDEGLRDVAEGRVADGATSRAQTLSRIGKKARG